MDNIKISDANELQRVVDRYCQFIYDSDNDDTVFNKGVKSVLYFNKVMIRKTVGCDGIYAKFLSESSIMAIPFVTHITLNTGFILGDIITIHTGADSKAIKLICR